MKIQVWDSSFISKGDFLGQVVIELEKLEIPYDKEHIFPLQKRSKYPDKVQGEINIKIKFTRVIERKLICHYKFEDNFEETGMLKDFSGCSNYASLKTLSSGDLERCAGPKKNVCGAKFSGFNFAELSNNPTEGVPELSISLWFLVNDEKTDYVLLSTLKRFDSKDKKKSKKMLKTKHEDSDELTQNIKQYQKQKDFQRYSGWLISTKKNLFYDNDGNNIIIPEEGDDQDNFERSDYFKPKEWNHIVITFCGCRLKEYINGVLVEDSKTLHEPFGDGTAVSWFFTLISNF